MSGRRYLRGARLTLSRPAGAGFFADQPGSALVIERLEMRFSVTRRLKKEPDTCDVQVYNLNPDQRAACQIKPLRVELAAGYDGDLARVIAGDVRLADSRLARTDWVTRLQVADGARAFKYGLVSRSYRAGVDVETLVREAAASMGLELPRNMRGAAELSQQFASGATLHGYARDAMTSALAAVGLDWSIQDGALQILRPGETRAGETLIVSVETGMIDSPEFATPEKKGASPRLQVRTLLRPEILAGTKIRVESRSVGGLFRVEEVTHSGDTMSGEAQSAMECKPL